MKQKEVPEFTDQELGKLTDQELIDLAKKMKSTTAINALFIGFLMGIIFYSIAKNSWGFVTLIPLYFAYKLITNPKNKNNKVLEKVLNERNLKK